MTNVNRIRNMTDEELALYLCAKSHCSTCEAYDLCDNEEEEVNGYLKWLKQEEEDEIYSDICTPGF